MITTVDNLSVTPYAGVWIEISLYALQYIPVQVTPYAGVWIEIESLISRSKPYPVTPYAGVWIEILFTLFNSNKLLVSLPMRECGLKCF